MRENQENNTIIQNTDAADTLYVPESPENSPEFTKLKNTIEALRNEVRTLREQIRRLDSDLLL